MSKYWNKEWKKDSVVLAGMPDVQSLEEQIERARASGHDFPDDVEPEICRRSDGLFRMAIVGPDYSLLVSAPDREKAAVLQKSVGRLTFYFICSRPQIRIVEAASNLSEDSVTLVFEALLDDGSAQRFELRQARPDWLQDITFVRGGRALELLRTDGETVLNDAALIAQASFVPHPFAPSPFDLRIHYIGRARGEVAETCALDRLASHEKYQRVMEEVLEDPHRNRDVWLVLSSGTTMNMLAGHSDRSFDPERLRRGDAYARATLSENDRVDVTEAMLINYFKPHLNTQHVRELNLRGKVLKKCLEARLTGLTLVFGTEPLGGIAMYTAEVPPKLHHTNTVCLMR